MRPIHDQRGVTITEVLISMLVVVIGLLGLTKVAAVAIRTNTTGSRLAQALDRAQSRLEALRNVPTATLSCLAGGGAPASCLGSCQSGGGELVACQQALGLTPNGQADAANTPYTYAFQVRRPKTNLYDIQVVVTFSDDTTNPARPIRIVLRTAEYR